MFRQVGIGAAVVVTAGLMAVGCNGGGDTIIQGTSGGSDLNNSDAFSATSIASNNLAPDGGGMSPDGMDAKTADLSIHWACDVSQSDGTFGGDNSALVIFQVKDGNRFRKFVTHYNGSFVEPVEVKFPDMDEEVGSNVGAAVALHVDTSGYTGGSGQTTAANDARANDGNWYILMDYTTKFRDPRLDVSHKPATNTLGEHRALGLLVFVSSLRDIKGITASTKVGGVTQNFVNGFQEIGTEVEIARGGKVLAATTNGGEANPGRDTPASDITSFGFVSNGFAGQTRFGGDSTPMKPKTAGEADYQRATPVQGALRTATYASGEQTNFIGIVYTQIVNSFSTGGAGGSGVGVTGSGAAPPSGSDLGGEDLKMFFVGMDLTKNVVESTTTHQEIDPPTHLNANTGALSAGTAFYPDFSTYNQFVFVKYADASLNTAVANHSHDPYGLQDEFNDNSATESDAQRWFQAETGGHEGRKIVKAGDAPAWYEDITARFVVVDDGDGTCSIGTGAGGVELRDNNFYGTDDTHDTLIPTFPTTFTHGAAATNKPNNSVYPNNREMQNYNQGTGWVFGADEGLLDTVVFYTSSPNSDTGVTGSAAANIDRELMAIGLANDGTLLATTTLNPKVLSTHGKDFQDPGADPESNASGKGNGNNPVGPYTASAATLRDPLLPLDTGATDGKIADGEDDFGQNGNGAQSYFRAVMNRTGQYVVVGYLQDQGTSLFTGTAGGFRTALCAVVYQTQRDTTGAGTGTSSVLFENRFSAPTVVSDVQAVTLPKGTFSTALTGEIIPVDITHNTGVGNNRHEARSRAERRESWTSLPVNQFKFQDALGYRCGVQGNKNILNVLWEQSDSTEDRLFARQLQITQGSVLTGSTPPSITLGTTGEVDGADQIEGSANFHLRATQGNNFDVAETAPTSKFRFINGDLRDLDVACVDLGDDDQPTTTNGADGGVLIVYAKTIDNTTTDNNLADAAVCAVQFVNAAIGAADRVFLNNNVRENAKVNNKEQPATGAFVANTNGDLGVGTSPGGSTNGDMTFGKTGTGLANGEFRTGVAGLLAVGRSNDITSGDGSNDASAIYIYFYDPRNDNVSSGRALFTRKYNADVRGDTQQLAAKADLGDRFVPSIDQGVASPGFLPPTRLDHLQGGDVEDDVTVNNDGATALVLWIQDGHLWAQTTSDGETYLTTNGSPNPALVDNDTTADIVTNQYKLSLCDDGACGSGDGILAMIKFDTDNDNRLRFRTGAGGL